MNRRHTVMVESVRVDNSAVVGSWAARQLQAGSPTCRTCRRIVGAIVRRDADRGACGIHLHMQKQARTGPTASYTIRKLRLEVGRAEPARELVPVARHHGWYRIVTWTRSTNRHPGGPRAATRARGTATRARAAIAPCASPRACIDAARADLR